LEYYQSELREKSDKSSQSSLKGGSRLKKEAKTASSERFELILDVLHLYQTDPQLAILVYKKEQTPSFD
jgi:neurofibromin 1